MPYESPLKYFRDQYKNPDKYKEKHPDWRDPELGEPDLGEPDNQEDSEIDNKEKEIKIEKIGEAGKKYQETIDLIKSIDLKPEFKDDSAEKNIIENRREAILRYLTAILEDARNYLSQVNYLQLQKIASYDDVAKYQEAVSSSDGLRRVYHNKLISDLKIAMRLININFNADFSEELRLNEELKMTDRNGFDRDSLKKKMAEREYAKFPYPAGIFIDFSRAPKDPQGEREYIANWALTIYSDLSALKK